MTANVPRNLPRPHAAAMSEVPLSGTPFRFIVYEPEQVFLVSRFEPQIKFF